ncbi:MAG: substrate-binding domain-containing protein [Opitutaceae bacterium]|jgi:LacI family transcriptional regulator
MKPPVSSYAVSTPASGPGLRRQIEATLRDWLMTGRYGAGDQLPPAREIARECGDVNEQTVRRALKNLMNEGLLRGAQGKGVFVSSTGARYKRVALVLPNLEDETTQLIARGARRVFDTQGFQTLILDAQRDSDQERVHLATLPDLPVDGTIIFPVAYGDIAECILRLKLDGMSLVLVDKYCPGIKVDCVVADDYQGAYALTTALIAKGRRRIAWLDGEAGSTTVENRFDGYRWALGDQCLPVERALVRRMKLPSPTSPYVMALEGEIKALLELAKAPDGLVCANDLLAVAAVDFLRARGVRVPEDIGVAGFGDLRMAVDPDFITTVHTPLELMGERAAQLLLKRIQSKKAEAETIVLPVQVILRRST